MENNQKYCHNCGVNIPTVARFCTQCGTSQSSLAARPPEPEPEQHRQQYQRPGQQQRPRIISSFRPIMGGHKDDDDEMEQDRIESINDLGITFAQENFGIEELPQANPNRKTIGQVWEQEGVLPPAPLHQRDVLTSPNSDARAVMDDFKQTAGGVPTTTLAGNVPPESRMHGNAAARD